VSHDDLSGFGALGNAYGHNGLGPEVTLNDDGQLGPMNASTGHGGSGGSSLFGRVTAPTPTVVTSHTGNGALSIDLIWDTAIASADAVTKSNFMNTVISSAQMLVDALGDTMTHRETVYVDIGWGEIAGQGMSPSALGESMTNGYLVTDPTVVSLLTSHGYTPGSSTSLTSTTQFFLPTAEAKALGLAGASPGSVLSPDGYVGFSTLKNTGYSWQYTDATGKPFGVPSSTQFSLQGVVWHELTEAMGRISMEGLSTFHGQKTFTPLDLFDYSTIDATKGGTLALSNNGGVFSADGGKTSAGVFNNNKSNGGDIADWSSYGSPTDAGTTLPTLPNPPPPGLQYEDAFNAFGYPGYTDALTPQDILVMKALGY
jgi:hypothetical protein